MNIAVVDSGGNLVAHVRQDGAWIGSINISINKAWTSRAFDISTKDLGDNSQPTQQFFGIHTTNGGKVAIFAGGIPLVARRRRRRCHRRQRRLGRAGPLRRGSRSRRLLILGCCDTNHWRGADAIVHLRGDEIPDSKQRWAPSNT